MTDRRRTYCYVVGTRPNFMKTAPVLAAMRRRVPTDRHVLVHTGQHYDDDMSRIFFEQLGVPAPDHYLGVGSGGHAAQTARAMEGLEGILMADRPDILIVPGDVNSTLAAALTASKLGIPIAHIESGLRSFDRTMPEEINRVMTDQVAALLFTHSPEARPNLLNEGIDDSKIHFVGNTMIDCLVALQRDWEMVSNGDPFELDGRPYLLVTLHRPALVDGPLLGQALAALREVAADLGIVFPVHPRTRAAITARGWDVSGIELAPPLGYLQFIALQSKAAAVLTDSGGVQEEATFLGVPCFTLRANTERPVTLTAGTNMLLGLQPGRIAEIPRLLGEAHQTGRSIPEGWDGHAAERAADVLVSAEI